MRTYNIFGFQEMMSQVGDFKLRCNIVKDVNALRIIDLPHRFVQKMTIL